MKPEYIQKIQMNYNKLRRIISISVSVNHLKEAKVLRKDEVDDIMDNSVPADQRIHVLLKKIMSKDDQDFVSFLGMLRRTGQTDAFNLLSDGVEIQYDYDDLMGMFNQACSLNETLQTELAKLKTQVDVTRNNNINYLKKIQRLEKERDDMIEKVRDMKDRLDERDKEITLLKIEIEELKRDRLEASSLFGPSFDDDTESQSSEKSKEEEDQEQLLRERLKENADEISGLRGQLSEMVNKMTCLITEIGETNVCIKETEKERQEHGEEKVQILQNQIEELKQAFNTEKAEMKREFQTEKEGVKFELDGMKSKMNEFMNFFVERDKQEKEMLQTLGKQLSEHAAKHPAPLSFQNETAEPQRTTSFSPRRQSLPANKNATSPPRRFEKLTGPAATTNDQNPAPPLATGMDSKTKRFGGFSFKSQQFPTKSNKSYGRVPRR